MQGNKNYVEDPSQVSGSGQEDSPSVFPHSSKLRNKLEKLAQWRIDPSLIEFPQDTREFRGGFAKVSRGLLAAPSRAKGEFEQEKGEQKSSEAGRPQSYSIAQEPGEEEQSEDEEAGGRMAGGDNDETNEEAKKDENEEQNPHNQTSVSEIGHGSAWPEHAVNAGPDLVDRNSQLENDPQGPDGEPQKKDEGTDIRIAHDNTDQPKEEPRRDPGDAEGELHPDGQISTPKVGGSPPLASVSVKH